MQAYAWLGKANHSRTFFHPQLISDAPGSHAGPEFLPSPGVEGHQAGPETHRRKPHWQTVVMPESRCPDSPTMPPTPCPALQPRDELPACSEAWGVGGRDGQCNSSVLRAHGLSLAPSSPRLRGGETGGAGGRPLTAGHTQRVLLLLTWPRVFRDTVLVGPVGRKEAKKRPWISPSSLLQAAGSPRGLPAPQPPPRTMFTPLVPTGQSSLRERCPGWGSPRPAVTRCPSRDAPYPGVHGLGVHLPHQLGAPAARLGPEWEPHS